MVYNLTYHGSICQTERDLQDLKSIENSNVANLLLASGSHGRLESHVQGRQFSENFWDVTTQKIYEDSNYLVLVKVHRYQ